jgi:hypothetical protein
VDQTAYVSAVLPNVTVAPRLDSISPAQGLIGATTSGVTFSGKGLNGATVSDSIGGITATVKSSNDTTLVADLAIAANAAAGNHSISVSAGGQASNSVNFFVQVPTFFTPTSANTALNITCAASNGFFAFVDYQLSDQNMNPISVAGLTPQESVSQNGGPFSTFKSFSTPVATRSDGTFEDIPVGTCFSVRPPPNRCIPVSQRFQILVPGVSTPFPITTTTSRTDCEQGIKIVVNPVPPGTTYTFGILN